VVDAADVLTEILGDGPVAAKIVQREARDAGVSEMTLRRAADRLGRVRRRLA